VVVCWTEGGLAVGGTATAIKLAERRGIPVVNLAALAEAKLAPEPLIEAVLAAVPGRRRRG
jgi:hypothetical protein